MYRECLPSKQLTAWSAAALIPVGIQLLSGGSWAVTGIVGIACSVLVWCVWRWGGTVRALAPLHILFLTVLIGELVSYSAMSWPGGDRLGVPLILIALAGWSSWKGAGSAARVGSVLFWAVLSIYIVVAIAGVDEMQWSAPGRQMPVAMAVLVFLIPAAVVPLLGSGRRWKVRLLLPVLAVTIAGVLTAGVLSADVASNTQNAFYEMCRSLKLFGTVKRFEAIVSAAMTVGWYSLIALLLSVSGSMFESLSPKWGRWGVLISAGGSAVWLLVGSHISVTVLAILAAVFWVLVPVLSQGIDKRKKL